MTVDADLVTLDEIQRRVLWLATYMVEVANHQRPNTDGLKVGGHQASCASMVTMMTGLYLHHLNADDFVAVKPHGSPVLHALNHLMGTLDPSFLPRLRAFGGLQAYPSRTKDPDRVDFSTGSVGLGPAATLFAAQVRGYVEAHFGERPPSRFFAVVGDAELDEGNIWEAIHDPAMETLGSVTWLIDFNRQSLDRVVPDIRINPWHNAFTAHGWEVVEVKYGSTLRGFASRHDEGADLLEWIDAMPNERYQGLFTAHDDAELRELFLDGAPRGVRNLLADLPDDEVATLVTDLGGHDMATVCEALTHAGTRQDRPVAIFFYTHKGWGLPIRGALRNHAAVLTSEQVTDLRDRLGIRPGHEWDRFPDGSPAGRLLAARAEQLRRTPPPTPTRPVVPATTSPHTNRAMSTQEAFGRLLLDLSRDPQVSPFLVTTSPDVATSTNLAGWINKVGVFAERRRPIWPGDPLVNWREEPAGQHIALGISEMNYFLLLGQLGLAEHFSGQRLLPVGTIYDPFVSRGLDALTYSTYSGASFVFAGTPSGITLAPEGGAHQSTVTASIGTELPGLTLHEPAFVQALDWLACDALARVADSDDLHPDAHYFRLTTRPLDQSPFSEALDRYGAEGLRARVLEGAYVLRSLPGDPDDGARVTLATCGAVVPEVLAAAAELADEGVAVDVVDLPSPGRVYRAWRLTVVDGVGSARAPILPEPLRCFPAGVPVVTVQDASSHHLAWLGGALGVRSASLGVDAFGQSGSVDDLYRAHHLQPGSIVNAALGVLAR